MNLHDQLNKALGRRSAFAIVALLILCCSSVAPAHEVRTGVDVCFVPADACEPGIVQAIDAARTQIRAEAYGFTAAAIIQAFVRARQCGVDVAVLLDRSNEGSRYSGLSAIEAAGIPVWIDAPRGIAHMKSITIDRHLVIGGSYNYTASAKTRNVEDVTFIESSDIASRFPRNWDERRNVAVTASTAAGTAAAPAPIPAQTTDLARPIQREGTDAAR